MRLFGNQACTKLVYGLHDMQDTAAGGVWQLTDEHLQVAVEGELISNQCDTPRARYLHLSSMAWSGWDHMKGSSRAWGLACLLGQVYVTELCGCGVLYAAPDMVVHHAAWQRPVGMSCWWLAATHGGPNNIIYSLARFPRESSWLKCIAAVCTSYLAVTFVVCLGR